MEVETTAAVLAAKERLQKAGLATLDEMNVDCCFALQDKVWITDPEGNRWEVFTSAARNPDLKFLRSNSILSNAQNAARQLSPNDH